MRLQRQATREGNALVLGLFLMLTTTLGCSAIVTRQIYVRQANASLQDYYATSLISNWTPSDAKRHAELHVGGVADFNISVAADEVIGVLGACDEDCTALTMQILDEEGFAVQTVSESTRHPFASLEPLGVSATYTVRIRMAECSSEPCFASYWTMREPSPEIERLYDYYIESLETDWAGTGPINRGDLDRLRSTNVPWVLLGGQQASVIAACDPNCTNLNVQIVDAEGFGMTNLVSGGSDQRLTATFDVSETGEYRVDIGMGECEQDPCSFAYWLLERRRPSETDGP